MKGLGENQEHLAALIGHLSRRLDDVMAQMVMLERTVQTALGNKVKTSLDASRPLGVH